MFYTVYKITNQLNGKLYIGAHQTSNLDDGYMGSGMLIARAISKYGIENFTKEYLLICNSAEEMFDKEKDLVFVGSGSYNLKPGGTGGWEAANRTRLNKLKNDPEYAKRHSETMKRCNTRAALGTTRSIGGFEGKTHSEESKRQMSEVMREKHAGSNNPRYGSKWIHNLELEISKSIDQSMVASYLEAGWKLGRKMKF